MHCPSITIPDVQLHIGPSASSMAAAPEPKVESNNVAADLSIDKLSLDLLELNALMPERTLLFLNGSYQPCLSGKSSPNGYNIQC
jgi:hypothetical protein